MSDLSPLFAPRSVAVLGASRDPKKLGYRLLQNLKAGGFAGAIHAVNPSGEPILGCASMRSVDALPAGVDLALVSLPAPSVPDAIRALAARRARAAVILSSGFGEVDADGGAAQSSLLDVARAAGLRLVGPNCMGVYSAPVRLNGTYFWDLPAASGGIAVVSQSGAYGGLVFRDLGHRGLGIARFVSIGNQVDVDVTEVLDFLAGDSATTLVACFVEALGDGRRFVDVASRLTADKPLVLLKGGRSDAGRRAAASHTGALAGGWEVYRAAFRRAGAVVAEETEEFLDAVETLVVAGARRPAAPRVAVLTVSGGPSVVAADTAEREGLAVPALDEATRAALRGLLPAFAAVGNPVDLTPQVEPARIGAAIERVFDQRDIAGAVAVDVGLDLPEFADALVAAVRATDKPAVAFTADAPTLAQRLRDGGIPVLPSPERAVRAWKALWQARRVPAPRAARPHALPAEVARALETPGALEYAVARRLLEAAGVRFCREAHAATADEAVAAAQRIGYPVVVKAAVPGLAHKTEVGGVALNLADGPAVRLACSRLVECAGARRFVVQEHVGGGVELLLGARRDETFGPVVALGAGGILTEALGDVAVRLAPLSEADVREMASEGVRSRLLAGPRGLLPVDVAALVRVVVAVGDLIAAERRIVDIDVNPLICRGPDIVAVDALVVAGG